MASLLVGRRRNSASPAQRPLHLHAVEPAIKFVTDAFEHANVLVSRRREMAGKARQRLMLTATIS